MKPSADALNEMYWLKGMSTRQVSEACEVSQRTICRLMIQYGIPRRNAVKARLDTLKRSPELLEKLRQAGYKTSSQPGHLDTLAKNRPRSWPKEAMEKGRRNAAFNRRRRALITLTCGCCGSQFTRMGCVHRSRQNAKPRLFSLCSSCVHHSSAVWQNICRLPSFLSDSERASLLKLGIGPCSPGLRVES